MKVKYDQIDEENDKKHKEIVDSIKNGGHMNRMLKVSEPKYLIGFGTLVSVLNGALFPFIGIYLGKMLFVLQPDDPIT